MTPPLFPKKPVKLIARTVACLLAGLALCSCEKPPVVPEQARLMFTQSITLTPLNDAGKRYSDFRYSYRKMGENAFTELEATSVVPTKDNSVLATFTISIDDPVKGQEYESFISYKLDGVTVVRETKKDIPRR